MSLLEILEAKEKVAHTTSPDTWVLDAVGKMCEARVGALLVSSRGSLVGILSERDVMTRVVLAGRDPCMTRVSAAMTTDIVTVDIRTAPEDAMALMTERRFRHLPVTDSSGVVGVVSVGDLVRWVEKNMDFELRALRDYVSGSYPCTAPTTGAVSREG